MLKSCELTSTASFYYDADKKTIARFPTNSNLIPRGSDNSLYFGMVSNKKAYKAICELFGVKDLSKVSGTVIQMSCGSNDADVTFNINAQGQMQLKLSKDGILYKLTNDYAYSTMTAFDFTKLLIVFDFANKEIRFKDPDQLCL